MELPKLFSVCLFFAFLPFHAVAWGAIYNTEAAYQKAVSSGKPTLLEFGAPWCAACSHTLPVIEAVVKEKRYSGRLNVVVINIDDSDDLRMKYRINSIPVQIFMDGTGKEVKRHFGALEKKELDKILEELVIRNTSRK